MKRKSRNLESIPEYLKEVKSFPNLTRDDEQALGKLALNDKEPQAAKELVERSLRLVVFMANTYSADGVDYPDLIQEGNLFLLRAAKKFDFKRNVRFSTYASWWVRQALDRFIDGHAHSVSLPSYLQKRLRRINRFTASLWQSLDREPTLEEITNACGLSAESIMDVTKFMRTTVNFDEMQLGSEANGSGLSGEIILDPNSLTPLQMLEAQEEFEQVSEEVKRMLSELARALESVWLDRKQSVKDLTSIFCARYGFDGSGEPKTLEKIGPRYNVNRERTRQLEGECWKCLATVNSKYTESWLKRKLARIRELEDIVGIVSPIWAAPLDFSHMPMNLGKTAPASMLA